MSNQNYQQNGAGGSDQTAVAEPAGSYGRNRQPSLAEALRIIEANTAVLNRVVELIDRGTLTMADAVSEYAALDLSAALLDGKVYWKIKGGKFSKHGLTLWPEVAAAYGIDLDGKDIRQTYPMNGWTVVYSEGDPPRIEKLIKPEPPQAAVPRQPQTNTPPPGDPNPHFSSDRPSTLPDYRVMAGRATQRNEFDYAAFMALKNGLYTEQSHITKTTDVLAEYIGGWKLDGGLHNAAMLAALETYRDERNRLELDGKETAVAHKAARSKAAGAYRKTLEAM